MLVKVDNRQRRLADFLIIGAAKSGTTSLYHYLGQHPALYFPPHIKEPGYLCFADMVRPEIENGLPDLWGSAVTDLGAYCSLFDSAPPESLLGEATPEYLFLADCTVRNIDRLYGGLASRLKFFVILRNPVDRIWSHYWMMLRDGYENLSFDDATAPDTIARRRAAGWNPTYDYVGYGRYADQLTTYLRHFGSAQFQIVLHEDLLRESVRVCASMFCSLGVTASFVPDVSVKYNVSGQLRHPWLHRSLFTRENFAKRLARRLAPHDGLQRLKARIVEWNTEKRPMPPEVRNRFLGIYRDDILQLSRLIDRKLDHWLAP
jgi:hypothetical protein